MVPLPAGQELEASDSSEAEEEAEPAPSSSESDASDSEEEAFLSQLAQALADGPPSKRHCPVRAAPHAEAATSSQTQQSDIASLGPTHWPVEVKSAVAAFLPWRELPLTGARISQNWHILECSDSLWKEYFRIQWPRLFLRKAAAHPQGGVPWRALFRQRWAEPNRYEDAEQEDWNDFNAALDLWKGSGALEKSMAKELLEKSLSEEQLVQLAVRRFKEDHLRLRGVQVPDMPLERGAAEHCAQRKVKCKHRPVPIAGKLDGCLFVCESCGDVHTCRTNVPCEGSELSGNNVFLSCPLSGICCDSGQTLLSVVKEDGADAAAVHDWDPELSASAQHARWFEQGYSMDEEQADDFFDGGSSRKQRQRGRRHLTGSAGSKAQIRCQECC